MTTLSSLVVARQPGSIAKVDEALARQVVEGGDLGTSLLEVGALSEAALLPLLGEAHGIEPAPSRRTSARVGRGASARAAHDRAALWHLSARRPRR